MKIYWIKDLEKYNNEYITQIHSVKIKFMRSMQIYQIKDVKNFQILIKREFSPIIN